MNTSPPSSPRISRDGASSWSGSWCATRQVMVSGRPVSCGEHGGEGQEETGVWVSTVLKRVWSGQKSIGDHMGLELLKCLVKHGKEI